MKLTKKQLSKFEVGISSNWIVIFEDKRFNIIGGIFPAITVKFQIFEPNNTEIEVGPNYRIKVPVSSKGPSTLDIEFYEDDKRTIQSTLKKIVNDSPMHKQGRSLISVKDTAGSISKRAIGVIVEEYSKTSELIKTHRMKIWPSSPLEMNGNQEHQAIQSQLSFDVLSYE